MKVRRRYVGGAFEDVPTSRLIGEAMRCERGQIESIESAVRTLTDLVAALVDRSGISDKDVLKLIGLEYEYDAEQ